MKKRKKYLLIDQIELYSVKKKLKLPPIKLIDKIFIALGWLLAIPRRLIAKKGWHQFKMCYYSHMRVKLVSTTSSRIEGIENAEEIIVYCARVSNPKNQLNKESSPKLLSFLIKHKHWSPFELASMCLEIKTSRGIAAQILRHRSFSFQEFSQRYSEAQELEPLNLRKQADKNRQSSSDAFTGGLLNTKVREHTAKSISLYNNLISAGVAKESARFILPLTTETTMYMQGSIRSWIHYIDLRSQENTQQEHREIAENCRQIFIDEFPNISIALGWK